MNKLQIALATLFAAIALAAAAPATAAGSTDTQAAEPAAGTEAAVEVDPAAVATRFLDRFEAGDFEDARVDFNAQMAGALDAGQLAALHAQLGQAGAAGERGEPRVTPHQGMQVVVFPTRRGDVALDATISVDGEGRIAGVFFTPAQAPGAE